MPRNEGEQTMKTGGDVTERERLEKRQADILAALDAIDAALAGMAPHLQTLRAARPEVSSPGSQMVANLEYARTLLGPTRAGEEGMTAETILRSVALASESRALRLERELVKTEEEAKRVRLPEKRAAKAKEAEYIRRLWQRALGEASDARAALEKAGAL
jgi:hypothetical protein